MDKLTKLNSLCCWIGDEGIFPCDSKGLPILEDMVYFEDIKPDWYQNLSAEDKEKISEILKMRHINPFNGN